MMSSQTTASLTVSSVLFVVTVALFTRYRKKQQYNENEVSEVKSVGSRGIAGSKPALPYTKYFFRCMEDPCDPILNPDGHIALCVAENKLVADLIAERLIQPVTASVAFSDSEVYSYNSFLGLPVAREALAYFLVRRFLMPDAETVTKEEALQHINSQNVAFASGCAALLNYLFYGLGEPNDVCLIPAPYYAAFEKNMSIIAGCKPFAVNLANPALGPTKGDLNLAYVQAKAQGHRVRFLLLTNPNNPLGVIYKPNVLLEAVEWARSRQMHTIVDEIYALSRHKKYGYSFQSIIRVLDNNLGDDVHMVWGLSKDFGASGFRVGCLYSQNKEFMDTLANLNYFSGVSHPMQVITADLLTDDEFVDGFLDAARDRLRHSYEICVQKLEEMVVPFIPAEAGLFVYVDFSSLLSEKSFEGEAALTRLMMEYARVVLTPGESQHERTPGMYRICFAWVSPEVLRIAMERLSKLVAKIRKMDWSDLNEKTLQGVLE